MKEREAPGLHEPAERVVWSDAHRIGVDEIDREHEALFQRFNELLAACAHGTDASRAAAVTLETVFLDHFAHEERLMLDIGFPGYDDHKRRHDEFAGILKTFTAFEPESGGFDRFFVSVFRNWILYHIASGDRQIGLFLAARGNS